MILSDCSSYGGFGTIFRDRDERLDLLAHLPHDDRLAEAGKEQAISSSAERMKKLGIPGGRNQDFEQACRCARYLVRGSSGDLDNRQLVQCFGSQRKGKRLPNKHVVPAVERVQARGGWHRHPKSSSGMEIDETFPHHAMDGIANGRHAGAKMLRKFVEVQRSSRGKTTSDNIGFQTFISILCCNGFRRHRISSGNIGPGIADLDRSKLTRDGLNIEIADAFDAAAIEVGGIIKQE